MIRILVTKDGATVVPKEVESLDDAKTFLEAGFHVDVETDAGRVPLPDAIAYADETARVAANLAAQALGADVNRPSVIGSMVSAVTGFFAGGNDALGGA